MEMDYNLLKTKYTPTLFMFLTPSLNTADFWQALGLFFITFFDKFINSPYIFKEKILTFELPLNVVEKKP